MAVAVGLAPVVVGSELCKVAMKEEAASESTRRNGKKAPCDDTRTYKRISNLYI